MQSKITYETSVYFYQGKELYIFYRVKDGKRKFLFGNIDWQRRIELLNDPERIEATYNSLNFQGKIILGVILIGILIYILT